MEIQNIGPKIYQANSTMTNIKKNICHLLQKWTLMMLTNLLLINI